MEQALVQPLKHKLAGFSPGWWTVFLMVLLMLFLPTPNAPKLTARWGFFLTSGFF